MSGGSIFLLFLKHTCLVTLRIPAIHEALKQLSGIFITGPFISPYAMFTVSIQIFEWKCARGSDFAA